MSIKEADLRVAKVFQSGMVLQREKPIRVWGKAVPGAEVIVQLQGGRAVSTANAEGAWMVELPPMAASESEVLEVVASGETITYNDIAVGEVFVASGQSNMEFFMRYEKHKAETVKTCENSRIRFYDVPKVAYDGQNIDFDYSNVGIWRKANVDNLDYFSAVGYYFARALEKALDVPIGIIGCSWGGTTAAGWMRRDSAERLNRPEIKRFAEGMKGIPECDYRSYFSKNFLSDQGLSTWNPFYEFAMPRTPGPEEYAEFFANATMPEGTDFVNAVLPEHNPGSLFEYMVMSIAPSTISGVLWYQGESDDNEDEAEIRYAESLETVIADWRDAWKEQKLPFFLVQLPGFRCWGATSNQHYAAIRSDQQKVADGDENVYLCSIADVGEEFDIHPKDKKTVGERLALLAEKYLYGLDEFADAPVFSGAKRDGNQITLTFNHGDGLHIVGDQLNALQVSEGDIAIEYDSCIEDDLLVIKLKNYVPTAMPVRVSFAQDVWYKVNLYNGANLPAVPFDVTL